MRWQACFLCAAAAGTMFFSAAAEGFEEKTPRGKALELIRIADSLRMNYIFDEAAGNYRRAAEILLAGKSGASSGMPADSAALVSLPDSLSAEDSVLLGSIEEKRLAADNGVAMCGYVGGPVVVAKHKFSLEDFHLYYPLPDKSWRPVPNSLDSTGAYPYSGAVFIPEGSKEVYFSAPDKSGARNIYRTEFKDSLWSQPALLDESMTSPGDEIYPMLSPDRKTLYFASSGLYGVGGFDIYKSVWDEERGSWGVPSNLGFPYSSPYNDFLYMDTEDGKYTVFASDRECPAGDSVTVYVLEYDSMPVRKAVDDPAEIRSVASLEPVNDLSMMDTGSTVSGAVPENVDTRKYMAKMEEVRVLKDSVSVCTMELESMRAAFAENHDRAEKEKIAAAILKRESQLPSLNDSLARAVAMLQDIEMEFLFNGVVIDPEKVMAQADREVVGTSSNYVFSRLSPGPDIAFEFEKPKVEFDYSFMILPEGRFALDNALPDGIVYQIQMFMLTTRASVRQLKGISPVFCQETATGKYIYRAGLFRTYNDVLSNLNKVRRLGFKTAFVVAFKDGEPLPVAKARALEGKEKAEYHVRIVAAGQALSDMTVKTIRQMTDKDIARTEENGRTVFVIGAFDSLQEAEKIEAMIKVSGEEEVSVVKK